MKTISHFNQATCRETRSALDAAIRLVSQEFGIRISLGRGTFTEGEFRMKLTCNTLSDGNMTKTLPIIHTNLLPGTPIGMGTTFKVRTGNFTITKVYPNRPKYKFVATNQNGTRYKFDEASIRKHIANGI